MTKKTQKLRKVLTLAACAVLLVCVTIVGTVAYLTSDDSVTNTFTVGNVVITMDETDVDKDDNTEDNINGRDKANTYNLLPGHTYTKDPIVHVDPVSEDCYVFIKVENQIADIEDANSTIASQITANGWTPLDGVGGVYYKVSNKADTDRELEVFATVKIDGNVNNATLATYENKTVNVTAYAIQKDGFTTAIAAWNAGNADEGGWN